MIAYGYGWSRKAAKDLGVQDRALRYWFSGERLIPEIILRRLARRLELRTIALEEEHRREREQLAAALTQARQILKECVLIPRKSRSKREG